MVKIWKKYSFTVGMIKILWKFHNILKLFFTYSEGFSVFAPVLKCCTGQPIYFIKNNRKTNQKGEGCNLNGNF